jgi:uracil-DNA glycosylase
MTNLTGIPHIGAIGGNVLKYFTIIGDFTNKSYYIHNTV